MGYRGAERTSIIAHKGFCGMEAEDLINGMMTN